MRKKIHMLLLENGISIDYDVFQYGLTILIRYIIFFSLIIPISIIMKNTLEVLFFLIIYTILRRYIGGFHFEKKILCTVFSPLFAIGIPMLSEIDFKLNDFFIIIVFSILIFTTFKIRTVDHPNKKLTNKEIIIYTKKAIIIELIYTLLSFVLLSFNLIRLLNIIIYTNILLVLATVMQKIKNISYESDS